MPAADQSFQPAASPTRWRRARRDGPSDAIRGNRLIQVEVRSKIPGATGDGVPHVLVELASERTTTRELIRRAVEEQIRLLRVGGVPHRPVLDRQYMSEEDIREQAATGAIRMPKAAAGTDVEAEVARAFRAFERNVFVVFVGGRQVDRLDDEIVLRLGEPVVFLRLTALVGG